MEVVLCALPSHVDMDSWTARSPSEGLELRLQVHNWYPVVGGSSFSACRLLTPPTLSGRFTTVFGFVH